MKPLKERKWAANGLLFLKYLSDSFTQHKRPSAFGPKPVYTALFPTSTHPPRPQFLMIPFKSLLYIVCTVPLSWDALWFLS